MKNPSPGARTAVGPSRPATPPGPAPSVVADTAARGWTPSERALAAERQALDWLHRHELARDPGIRERIESIHVGAAFVMLFPRAEPEIQELASDVFTWITAFGDVLVDGRAARDAGFNALMLELSELLHGTHDTGTGPGTGSGSGTGSGFGAGFAAALADLLRRCDGLLPAEHGHRVRQSLASFVMTQNWHVNTLADGLRPGMAEYVVARRHLVGGWALIALLGPLEDFRFAGRRYRDPCADGLDKAACDLLAWLNDLSSHERERRAGDAELTLPSIVARERGCTLPESLAVVAGMCDERTLAARRLTERARAAGDREMTEYGEVVCGLMGHIAHWHTTIAADRYR